MQLALCSRAPPCPCSLLPVSFQRLPCLAGGPYSHFTPSLRVHLPLSGSFPVWTHLPAGSPFSAFHDVLFRVLACPPPRLIAALLTGTSLRHVHLCFSAAHPVPGPQRTVLSKHLPLLHERACYLYGWNAASLPEAPHIDGHTEEDRCELVNGLTTVYIQRDDSPLHSTAHSLCSVDWNYWRYCEVLTVCLLSLKYPSQRPWDLGGAASWGIHNFRVIHNSLQFTGAYQSFSLWGGFLYC